MYKSGIAKKKQLNQKKNQLTLNFLQKFSFFARP